MNVLTDSANILALNNTNWDKELTPDEREVCSTQGVLFEFCQYDLNCDAFDFVNKFMVSDIAADIDKGNPAYYTADPFQMLYDIGKRLALIKANENYNADALHWIGYMYRYWAWLGTPSRNIIQIAPVEKAYATYPGLHTLAVGDAIQILVERLA
jgi:hypothetical protein